MLTSVACNKFIYISIFYLLLHLILPTKYAKRLIFKIAKKIMFCELVCVRLNSLLGIFLNNNTFRKYYRFI